MRPCTHDVTLLALSWMITGSGGGSSSLAASVPMETLRAERARLAAGRRVIFDNDGMDAQFLPTPTAEALLDVRTRALTKTQVTTVFYCSRSSGLGVFTHNTRVGEIFTSRVGRYRDNATAAFLEQGTDPLRIITDFCRGTGLEVFWTLRMNDCHDAIHRPSRPYPAFSRIKAEHPEWLIGRWDRRPPYGNWSAFDFAVTEVRQLVADCVEEVCRNYDVDGIHLDFCRHLNYFPDVSMGGRATTKQLDLMTGLVRRVRRITEEVGVARARALLLAVRVPDSVEYCRAMGLDIERWMAEGLLDLLVAGDCQLNPRSRSVELGHRYGVQVIAGLSEPGVRSERGPYHRDSEESYRARAAAAWASGCDGLYLFNLYRAEGPFLSEVHDPALLNTLEQQVFVTVRAHSRVRNWLAGGMELASRPLLTPDHPWLMKPGSERIAELELGDPAGRSARLLVLPTDPGPPLSVAIHGRSLTFRGAENDWLAFDVPAGLLRAGLNPVRIEMTEAVQSRCTFAADDIPKTWGLRGSSIKEKIFEQQQPDGLLIADRSIVQGHYHYRSYAWAVAPGGSASVTVRVRHLAGWSSLAFANGRNEDRLMLYPDRIHMQHSRRDYAMDTTDRFHEYRIEIDGHDYRVHVDGQLRIDGRDAYRGKASGNRTMVLFGAATSFDTGEAVWQRVIIETSAVALQDLVLVLPGADN